MILMDADHLSLLEWSSKESARGILRGILRYQPEHAQSTIDFPEQHRGASPPRWLRRPAN